MQQAMIMGEVFGDHLLMVLLETDDNESLTIFDVTKSSNEAITLASEKNALVVALPIVADFRLKKE